MRVLIDTNILVDCMIKREPFYNNAKMIIHFCVSGTVDGYVAAHSITDCFYILRKLPVE